MVGSVYTVTRPWVKVPVKARCLMPFVRLHAAVSELGVSDVEAVIVEPPANDPIVLEVLPVPGMTRPTSPPTFVTTRSLL